MKYYYEKFTLSDEDFDKQGNLLPFKILEIFEKGAIAHGELLGAGEAAMKEKNLFWVISRLKYKVLKPADKKGELTLKTWPLKPSFAGFLREYVLYDENEEAVIKASANWLTLSRDERKLKLGQQVFPDMEFSDEINFDKRIIRIRDFEGEPVKNIIPKKEYIDSNGHVNNKHYTDFMLEALDGLSGVVDSFQIDYVQEIMPSDKVEISVARNENEVLVKGEGNGKKHFFGKIIFM